VITLLPHPGGLDVFLAPRVEVSRADCPPLRWLRFEGGRFDRPPREVSMGFPDGTYYMGSELHLRRPLLLDGGSQVALGLGLPHGQGAIFMLDLPRQRVLKYHDLRGRDPLRIVRVMGGPVAIERPDLGGSFVFMVGSDRQLFEWFRPSRNPRPAVP
jgi:hypothetical protein